MAELLAINFHLHENSLRCIASSCTTNNSSQFYIALVPACFTTLEWRSMMFPENPLEHFSKRIDKQFTITLRNTVIAVVAVDDSPDEMDLHHLHVRFHIMMWRYIVGTFVSWEISLTDRCCLSIAFSVIHSWLSPSPGDSFSFNRLMFHFVHWWDLFSDYLGCFIIFYGDFVQYS